MRKKQTLAWVLCLMWMGVIFFMSAMPGDVSGEQSGSLTELIMSVVTYFCAEAADTISPDALETLVRKGAHMAEYAILFLLYRRALRLSGVKHAGITALCMCVCYAATDEIHQGFIDGRTPSVIDVGIDALGAGIAWLPDAIKRRLETAK